MADTKKLYVIAPDGQKLLWPMYGAEGQPLIILPEGEIELAKAERDAPNLHRRQILEGVEPGPLNKYGLPEGRQLGEDAGRTPGYLYKRGRQDETLYGFEVHVPLNSMLISGPSVPYEDRCEMWTVNVLQVNPDAAVQLTVQIDYALGGVNNTKVFKLIPSKSLRSIQVQGRRVRVTLSAKAIGETAVTDFIVQCEIERGQYYSELERYCPLWIDDAKVGGLYADYTPIFNGVSKHIRNKGTVLALGGATQLFPCICDYFSVGTPRPPNGTAILCRGPALTAANQSWDFSDEMAPNRDALNGLTFMLSTTPDVITAQAGATKWVEVKYGR